MRSSEQKSDNLHWLFKDLEKPCDRVLRPILIEAIRYQAVAAMMIKAVMAICM